MKELSIEEKAKRYDEALAMAKECITYIPDEAVNKYMLDMFPELKESDGERIRKQIISFLKEFEHDHYRSLDFSSWIAWLEKQGEQKSVNKVEPKFNLYDWVVTGKGDTVQIGAVNNGYYTLFNGMDFDMSYVDKYWHKWTIKDAKDGDVLANDTIVLIVDHLGTFENRPIIYSWYFADSNKFYGMGPSEPDRWEVGGFHPATKEQRDKLKKAMLKAGYKWDADKKELIRINV